MLADSDRGQLLQYLVVAEGLRLRPYWDCCGRGLRESCTKGPKHEGKLTIGIGRNIEDVGISAVEAHYLCNNDIDRAQAAVMNRYPWSQEQDPVRQTVLVELAFNMGAASLSKFVNTLAAFERKDYPAVAEGLRQSKWYRDVQPSRSGRILRMVETGAWL